MPNVVIHGGDVDEAEAAAALAAVLLLLESPAAQTSEAPARWRDSARLVIQGMTPHRVPATPRWNTIERLSRAGRGGTGIVGL